MKKWSILLALALIWGSSFILIKKSLLAFDAIQVGALRISIAAVFLLLVAGPQIRKISRKDIWPIVGVGICGSFFPAFLFAIAQTKLDSGITAILNSLVPLFTLLLGIPMLHVRIRPMQVLGILVGLGGTAVLIGNSLFSADTGEVGYMGLVMIATLCYGTNANLIKKYLSHVPSVALTTAAFSTILLPSLVILYNTGITESFSGTEQEWNSLTAVSILAIVGTGMALLLYNRLIQLSSPVFASSVTYLIPVVALLWGAVDGEQLAFSQVAGALTIILGVIMVNRPVKRTEAQPKESFSE